MFTDAEIKLINERKNTMLQLAEYAKDENDPLLARKYIRKANIPEYMILRDIYSLFPELKTGTL